MLSCSPEGSESFAWKEEKASLSPWGGEGKKWYRFCGWAEKLGCRFCKASPKIRAVFANKEVSLVPSDPQVVFLYTAAHEVCTSPQVPQSSHSPRRFSSGHSWLKSPPPPQTSCSDPAAPPSAELLQPFGGGTAQQTSALEGLRQSRVVERGSI